MIVQFIGKKKKMSPTKKNMKSSKLWEAKWKKSFLVTRDQLMNTIWGYSELDSRVLDNHVKNIRKKIPEFLLKLLLYGYQLGGAKKGENC